MSDLPEMPPEAAAVADLAERLLLVLQKEAAQIGPGLAKDIRGLLKDKELLSGQLAAALPGLAAAELSPAAVDYLAALDERLAAAAGDSEKALQATLDSTARIICRLAEIAGRKARPVVYGRTGTLHGQEKGAPGALPLGGKKV